ncbi:MbnH family di-heme enzyme [Aestuariibius insulae]|uniref:MbnH family di-heme enzyme n=1 Tax=Aestuariibius insulae TaxID=2058287 RepID=UPI00345E40C5
MSRLWAGWTGAMLLLSAATLTAQTGAEEAELRGLLHLPDHVELPAIPDYNPLTAEKIALGRELFYDTRLSGNQTQSCASCHLPELAFSDGVARSEGSTGQIHPRNSQSLANVAWFSQLTWASQSLVTLEEQIHIPIRSERPVELGVNDANAAEVLARFDDDPEMARLFRDAFPQSETGASFNKISFALASFLRTMTSFDSRADAFAQGDLSALTEEEQLGLALFNGERLECFHCHSGPTLTTAYMDDTSDPASRPFMFFSNGLYNVGDTGDYPVDNQGLFEQTQNPRHRGLFRAPSLRNIALTAPYMHDGSLATLEEVVDHYAAGGRHLAEGPFAGDGRLNPNKSHFVRGFEISPAERAALIAFLESLTDEAFLVRPDLLPAAGE